MVTFNLARVICILISLLVLVEARNSKHHNHKSYAKELRKPFQYSTSHVTQDPYLPTDGIATATYYVEGSRGPNACEVTKAYFTSSEPSRSVNMSYSQSFSGPAAALNQLAFDNGAVCGQCFHITVIGTPTPNNSVKTGKTLKIRIVDECPADASDSEWCAQSSHTPMNPHGAKVHFDLNLQSLPKGWFPERVGTLYLSYRHTPC